MSRGFSRPGGMQTKRGSSYSPSSYRPVAPPKPLTAEELKLKIANAPTNIMLSQKEAKNSLKMFYVLLASAIVSAIILVCVNQFVPHEYEVEYENARKEKVKQKKTSNSWWWPMFIFYAILGICCWYMFITWGDYQIETRSVSFTQNVLLPKWQSQLQSLTSGAAAS